MVPETTERDCCYFWCSLAIDLNIYVFLQRAIFGQAAARRPHDRKEDSAGAWRPCSRRLDRCRRQTHVACALLLSIYRLVVRVARVSRLAGSWLQPGRAIIASHLDQCPGHSMAVLCRACAAACTAPRAVPVRPSRARYSSLSQVQWPTGRRSIRTGPVRA